MGLFDRFRKEEKREETPDPVNQEMVANDVLLKTSQQIEQDKKR